jgi:hypothetical protein
LDFLLGIAGVFGELARPPLRPGIHHPGAILCPEKDEVFMMERKPELRNQITREQVLEYRKTSNPIIFAQLLKRLDGLLLHTIFKLKRNKSYLKRIEEQDLYHTAILGLHDAIRSMPEIEPVDDFPMRVISYIKSNIRKEFARWGRKEFLGGNLTDFAVEDINLNRFPLQYDVQRLLEKMVSQKLLESHELELLTERLIQGRYHKEIAEKKGILPQTASRQFSRCLAKVRLYLTGTQELY